MSMAINFEMVPSTSKPILTVFNGRMFSLLSKSMSQFFLLFSMTSTFQLMKVTFVNRSLVSVVTEMLSLNVFVD